MKQENNVHLLPHPLPHPRRGQILGKEPIEDRLEFVLDMLGVFDRLELEHGKALVAISATYGGDPAEFLPFEEMKSLVRGIYEKSFNPEVLTFLVSLIKTAEGLNFVSAKREAAGEATAATERWVRDQLEKYLGSLG